MLKDLAIELAKYDAGFYKYNLIQYHNVLTNEVFNLGVIVRKGSEIEIKVINDIYALSECLNIKNLSGLKFNLEILQKRINKGTLFKNPKISENLVVSEAYIYSSDEDIKNVAEELFKKNISLYSLLKKRAKKINPYDKPHIFKELKKIYDQKKYKYIYLKAKVSGVHKNIDAVVKADKKILVASEIESIYISKFMQSFAESVLLLQEARMAHKELKEVILYLPIIEKLTTLQQRNYKRAKEIMAFNQIKHIDTKDIGEYLGYLDSLASKYGARLLCFRY